MTIWTLVAIICLPGQPCQQADIAAFPTEATCLESVDAALAGVHREYVRTWVERTGTPPPPARIGAGCREDDAA